MISLSMAEGREMLGIMLMRLPYKRRKGTKCVGSCFIDSLNKGVSASKAPGPITVTDILTWSRSSENLLW